MTDFIEGQKAVIAELVERKARALLEREGYVRRADLQEQGKAAGLLTKNDIVRGKVEERKLSAHGSKNDEPLIIPDEIRAREIFAECQKKQPSWGDFREHIGTRLAGMGVAGAMILFGLDFAQSRLLESPSLLRHAAHWAADTDNRFDARLVDTARQAGISPPQGAVAGAIVASVKTHLDGWANEDTFENHVDAAVGRLADKPSSGNPLTELILAAFDARPLLMFHGEGKLGLDRPVYGTNKSCLDVVIYWKTTDRVEFLPEELRGEDSGKVCTIEAKGATENTLELPFYARFHTPEGEEPHTVTVVLQVRRYLRDGTFVPNKEKLDGISVHYISFKGDPSIAPNGLDHPGDYADAVNLTSEFALKDGFFMAEIEETVRNKIPDPTFKRSEDVRDFVHAIEVKQIDGKEVTAIVRAMILVNKGKL